MFQGKSKLTSWSILWARYHSNLNSDKLSITLVEELEQPSYNRKWRQNNLIHIERNPQEPINNKQKGRRPVSWARLLSVVLTHLVSINYGGVQGWYQWRMIDWHNIYINNQYQDGYWRNDQQSHQAGGSHHRGCSGCSDVDDNCDIGEMFEEEKKAEGKNNIVTEWRRV